MFLFTAKLLLLFATATRLAVCYAAPTSVNKSECIHCFYDELLWHNWTSLSCSDLTNISTSLAISAYLYWPTIISMWSQSSGFPPYRPESTVSGKSSLIAVAAAGWGHWTQSWATRALFIQSSHYLCYLTRTQTVIHLPTPPENVTTLTCEMQNFCNWMKVCCVPSNIGGSEKNRLWCVSTEMSSKHLHSKCSKWPPSAWIHASSIFCHWSVAWYTTLCRNSARRNKPLPQAETRPYQYTRLCRR